MKPPCPADRFELTLDAGDAFIDLTPIRFDLGLARPADKSETATLALQMSPASHQPAALIGKMGQFDLSSTFAGVRPGAENLEYQAGPVDDLALESGLEIALLDRSQFGIDADNVNLFLS